MEPNPYEEIFRLSFACMQGFREFESTPRDYGTGDKLYGSEIHTLQMIGKQGSCNLTNLARLLCISKSGVSKFVGKLLDKGLIVKERSEHSRKEIVLSLTDKGRIAYEGHEEFDRRMFASMEKLLNGLNDEQIGFIEAGLGAMAERLEELNRSGEET